MGLLAKRYVKALYDFAVEKGETKQVLEHMKHLRVAFQTHRYILSILENPAIPLIEKKNLLLQATSGKPSEAMVAFLNVLADNKRLSEIIWISHQYIDYYNDQNNIYEVKLTTAVEADDAVHQKTLERVEKELHGTVEVSYIHDPKIMGGFILDVGCNRWDASVFTTLKEIKKSLTS